jgi:hypothetical protein
VATSTSFISGLSIGPPLRKVLIDEMSQTTLQSGGVDQITVPLSGPDVVDKHVAHQQLAVGPADQVVAELQGDDPGICSCSAIARTSSSLSSQSSRRPSNLSTRRLPLERTLLPGSGTAGREPH